MMSEYLPELLPRELRQQLDANDETLFGRRCVLVRDPNLRTWVVLGCVLRPLEKGSSPPEPITYEYENAVLASDSLEASQCASFIEALGLPALSIAGRDVAFDAQAQTEVVRVGVRNLWMQPAGTVYAMRPKNTPTVVHARLLRPGNPYYPDPYEAARDWLGLSTHHGASDGNNGRVLFLLPETRGFIKEYKWASPELLELQVAGTAGETESLQILGAYWSPTGVRQLSTAVSGGSATLKIAHDAQRLELFVVGSSGKIYEQHQERLGMGPGGSRFLDARGQRSDATALVSQAVDKGEGFDVEFKEWVDVEGKLKANSKLMQVLETVAAFSNSSGGTIYIGVDDHSQVVGINVELAKRTDRAADEDAARRYLGELRTRVNDGLRAPASIEPLVAVMDGKIVAILRVAVSPVPISIGTDCILFVRKGGTNKKLPPDEWPSVAREPRGMRGVV